MDARELRESLQHNGPLLPAVFHEGTQIDGRRRSELCSELGIEIAERHCATLSDACAWLWTVDHKRRALELAGTRNVHELAELCGARPAAVARELRALGPRPKFVHKVPRQLQGQKSVQFLFWMEPQLKVLATRAAQREGLSLSAFFREAIYNRVQLVDGTAPLPGTHRAPAWIKPREKRNRAR